MKNVSKIAFDQAIRNNENFSFRVVPSMAVAIVALVALVIILLFMKETKYVLYEFSSSGQTFHRIDDASDLVSRSNALLGYAARHYVTLRETIDRLTDEVRYKTFYNQSSQKVYEEWKTGYKRADKNLGETGTRRITIELDNPFDNDWDSNVHIVEFSTKDTSDTGEVVEQYWKAVISYKFNQQKIRLDDLVQNPLGFEVIGYSIRERNPLNKVK